MREREREEPGRLVLTLGSLCAVIVVGVTFCVVVASTEMTVQNLEEKAALNETVERLKAQFAAVSANLEVQAADNSQLSR